MTEERALDPRPSLDTRPARTPSIARAHHTAVLQGRHVFAVALGQR